jgi:NAD(P)-dependent dehydrogenase (short-subunit alcohol dehydrogenase family)
MVLQGKVAVITDSAAGIGRALAERLAREGADLVLIAQDTALLDKTAEEMRGLGRIVIPVSGDVSVESTAQSAAEQADRVFGRIDILVNAAGIAGPTASIEAISLQEWNETLGVNLTAAFCFCKHAVPRMKSKRSGCIVNISSIAGLNGFELRSPYCASKWALIGLTRSVALEVGPYGIRANTVCPGIVEGDLKDGPEEVLRGFVSRIPLGRMVSKEEVASAVLFLASEEASAITGEEIIVSAGLRAIPSMSGLGWKADAREIAR